MQQRSSNTYFFIIFKHKILILRLPPFLPETQAKVMMKAMSPDMEVCNLWINWSNLEYKSSSDDTISVISNADYSQIKSFVVLPIGRDFVEDSGKITRYVQERCIKTLGFLAITLLFSLHLSHFHTFTLSHFHTFTLAVLTSLVRISA